MKLSIFILSLALIAVAYVPYISGIIKGKVKPHPITWLSWLVIMTVYASILSFNGGGYAAYVSWVMTFITGVVLILALKFRGKVAVTAIDILCFVASLIALLVWFLANQPVISVVLLTLSQLLGFIPTIRNTYHRPYDEKVFTWSVHAVRYVLLVIIVTDYTLTTTLNSLFWATVYGAAAAFLLIRRKQLEKKSRA